VRHRVLDKPLWDHKQAPRGSVKNMQSKPGWVPAQAPIKVSALVVFLEDTGLSCDILD
jgi:hypothetical protein